MKLLHQLHDVFLPALSEQVDALCCMPACVHEAVGALC